MRTRSTLLSLALLCTGGLAQSVTLDRDLTVAVGHGNALDVIDGTLTAIGNDYKATFADGELVYTPLLGKVAPRNLPLALQVTHVGRDGVVPVEAATTRHAGLIAEFVRPQLQERFEVRPEGLKQSFVFDRLPPGHGDLIVRSRLHSELQPTASRSTGSMQFLFPGAGGVEVGQVLGIDADGRTATGELRVDGEHLDVVLPAAFVAAARLPLVVDPLLSTVVVTTSTLADRAPDIAALPAPTDAFLVVWLRAVSATDTDVRAQRVSAGGTVGNLLMVETQTASSASVTVCGHPPSATWLIAFEIAGDVKARWVSGAGVMQTTTDIANGPNLQGSPVLAGGQMGNSGSAVCVFHDRTAGQIRSKRLDMVNQTGLFATTTIVSGTPLTAVDDPTISRDNLGGRPLVVWTTTNLLGQRALRGVVVDVDGAPLTPTFAIAGNTSTEAVDASLSGNGQDHVIAWRTANAILGDGAACLSLRFLPSTGSGLGSVSLGTPRSLIGPNGTIRSTSVAMFGGSAMVGFASSGSNGHDIRAQSIDPLLCTDCEGSLPVDTAGNDTGVAICSRAFLSPSAPTPSNDGAVAFIPLVAGQGDVSLRFLRADDGQRVRLDIACTPGQVLAPCARAGNSNYFVHLRGAAPNELALAIHATALMNFNCQPCLIGPDINAGVISFLGATSATGDIRAALPLPPGPAAIGATIHSQFVLFGGQCLGNFRGTGGISSTLH